MKYIVPLIMWSFLSPIQLSGEDRPVFQPRIKVAEFQNQLEKTLSENPSLTDLEQSNMPALGMRFIEVLPDEPGDKLGIKSGDILVAVDNEITWNETYNLSEDRPSQLRIYSASKNSLQTLTVQTDRLRVITAPVWNPEFTYLKCNQRSDLADRYLLAAIFSRSTAPEFAETALFHALENGYRQDTLTDQLGLEIALQQNKPDDALKFALALEPELESDSSIHPLLLIRAGFATGNFQLVKRVLAREDSEYLQEEMDWLTEAQAQAQETQPESLSDLAANMFRDDLTTTLMESGKYGDKTFADDIVAKKPLELKAEVAHFVMALLKAPVPISNFDVETSFDFAASGAQVSMFYKLFRVDVRQSGSRAFLSSIGVTPDGTIRLTLPGIQQTIKLFDASLSGNASKKATFRIVRVGPQLEVYLNEHRILLAPVSEDDNDVYFVVHATGMKVHAEKFTLTELITQP